MSTKAHAITRNTAAQWESMYSSAVLSGIVGDAAHQRGGGYHISIEDNSSTNYSVVRPDDKAPPGNWPRDLAAAIDMSMSPSDMTLCTNRLWDVWNDTSDPRHQYINGFNGWANSGDAKRYDFVTQAISVTTSDHKWHVHLEIRRRYVTDQFANDAILSILKGESKQQYIQHITNPGGIEDMFCKFGDGESPNTPSDSVATLQDELVSLGADLTPFGGVDGRYGNGTAGAMVAILGAEIASDGKTYGWKQYRALHTKVYGGSGGGTLPSTVNVSGQLALPTSIGVSGTLTIEK